MMRVPSELCRAERYPWDIVESIADEVRPTVAPDKDRMRRVDEAVREVISTAIGSGLKDPRIGFVTVTSVSTSPDLRHARVFVSVLGDDDQREQSLAGLESSRGYLQRQVASELRLKNTPQLEFRYDDSTDRGMRITELLKDEGPDL